MYTGKPIGKTKDQGWQIGVSRTFSVNSEALWKLLTNQPGLGFWFGHDANLIFKKGQTFQTKEGITGEIRSCREGSLVRMRWQPRDWNFVSTLQVRITPSKEKTIIRFHHEKLENEEQREKMRAHWKGVLDKLEGLIIEDI
jgi:uncharacterized protein YndB with AHSA1/START domain